MQREFLLTGQNTRAFLGRGQITQTLSHQGNKSFLFQEDHEQVLDNNGLLPFNMKLQSTVRHEFSKNLQKRPFMFKQLLFTGYYAKKKWNMNLRLFPVKHKIISRGLTIFTQRKVQDLIKHNFFVSLVNFLSLHCMQK